MAHLAAIKIGPRRYLDPHHDIVSILNPHPTIARLVEPASPDDLAAAEHLTWWWSPAAIAYRTGARCEHSTGLISRWSLVASTQGRYWIALEVWADREAKTSSKQLLPRHLHPSLFARQLDGEVTHVVRRAA